MSKNVISILGAGAWGRALAVSLGGDIILWARNVYAIQDKIESDGCVIPDNVSVTSAIEDTLTSRLIILAVPTQALRAVCKQLRDCNLEKCIPIVITCKGIEQSTLMLPSEVVREILPDNPVAVFSGPSFAIEVAKKLPYAMVVACQDSKLGLDLISNLQHENVKLALSCDIIGVQICAALKNVFAIACGVILGRKLGFNAHAMLITSSMNEIRTLYQAKTGYNNFDTLLGLACLGDLVMTCTSFNSRNLSFGYTIGSNNKCDIQQMILESRSIIEGISTAQSMYDLAQQLQINMPICKAIYKLLYNNGSIEDIITATWQADYYSL